MLRLALLLPAVVSVMAENPPYWPADKWGKNPEPEVRRTSSYCQTHVDINGLAPGNFNDANRLRGQGQGEGVWVRGKATPAQIDSPELLCYDDVATKFSGMCENLWCRRITTFGLLTSRRNASNPLR